MWGQENIVSDILSFLGIIPTRVGTRHLFGVLAVAHRDHPHACGDKFMLTVRNTADLGSSPRVWGQVERRAKVFVDIRIIPTRVGTSYVCKQNEGTQQDHPHACGDKLFLTQYQRQQIGSSPRVWGQDAKYSVCCPSVRIIPTRVGTSKHTITLVNGNKDHPHACGDKGRALCCLTV